MLIGKGSDFRNSSLNHCLRFQRLESSSMNSTGATTLFDYGTVF